MPGANEISKRLSMSLERLGVNMSRHKLDRNGEGLPLVAFHCLLPLCLLCFFGSCRWVALDYDMGLILGLPKLTRTFDSRGKISQYSFLSWLKNVFVFNSLCDV